MFHLIRDMIYRRRTDVAHTILLKRGQSADRETIIPVKGELILELDTNLLYVGDGETPGGILIANHMMPPLVKKLRDGDLKLAMQRDQRKFILDDYEDLL